MAKMLPEVGADLQGNGDSVVLSTTADRIRWRAKRLRMSLRELADASGVSYATLQKHVGGKHRMPADHVPLVAGALAVSCDWLLTGKPEPINRAVFRNALETAMEMKEKGIVSAQQLVELSAFSYDKALEIRILNGQDVERAPDGTWHRRNRD